MTILPYCLAQGEQKLVCAQPGCQDCLRNLLRENANLLWAVVHRQWPGQADYVDLWQEAQIGFRQALQGA